MNILFVSSQFPNPSEPNRGIFCFQIVRELAAISNIQVVAPVPTLGPLRFLDKYKKYRTNFDIPDKEVVDGIVVHHPKYFAMPGVGGAHPFAMYHSINSTIREIHNCWPIDAINCHWVFPDGVAAQKISNRFNIPILMTPLGTDLNSFVEYKFRKAAIKKALVGSDNVSVLCSPMYERCISLGVDPSCLKIIPNGVDLLKFSISDKFLCRKELDICENSKVILFVGSLVPVKGIDSLLKAFAKLKKFDSEGTIKLYIIGSGFLEKELKQLADELNVNDDTFFVGRVSHDKLTGWMNSADCLCLPSLSEGHPNVVMEALACGVPVVASSVGAVPDFVNDQTGQLITPGDYVDLADKLYQCLSTTYSRESIRATVEDMSWKRCAETYFNALKRLAFKA